MVNRGLGLCPLGAFNAGIEEGSKWGLCVGCLVASAQVDLQGCDVGQHTKVAGMAMVMALFTM